MNKSEEFHRYGLRYHLDRMTELCAGLPDDPIDDPLRVAVCDALGWAVRLHDDVLGRKSTDRTPVARGARWARNRIMHGDAAILAIKSTESVLNEGHFMNPPGVTYDDPTMDFNFGPAQGRFIAFAPMPDAVSGDQRSDLQPDYNSAVAWHTVNQVCTMLAIPESR